MTAEKIKEEFDKWRNEESYTDEEICFSGGIQAYPVPSAFHAGFKTAERLAKIEVLEELAAIIDKVLPYTDIKAYGYEGTLGEVRERIEELKAEK
jgi:hypothetical protein